MLCGYLKFGSFRLMPTVPALFAAGAVVPAQACGRFASSTVNAGTPAPVHERRTKPRPVFWNAFATRMNGGGPVKTPMLPRSWFV